MADESIKSSKKLSSTLFERENGNPRKVRRYVQFSLARQAVVKFENYNFQDLTTIYETRPVQDEIVIHG